MKDWIYGFFMTWGMFLAIPCPFRRWDENARGKMMVCLPFIGGVVGGLWVLASWGLTSLSCPGPIRALVLAVLPWLATGFLHLDGYMDVCDAVLSRRDLATRQKILKDSHCGAFAVIALGLLFLTQWSLFLSAGRVALMPLAMIPVATRACAGLAVVSLRPMGTSQYATLDRRGRAGRQAALLALALVAVGLPLIRLDGPGCAPLAAAAGYGLAAWYGFRQLDGMSGDISGFALTLGELAGVAILTLTR